MVCIYCGGKTQVSNSRPQKRTNQVWRRRECLTCFEVFTTNELADYSAVWTVLGRSGAQSAFLRDKLFMSLYKSLQHRPLALSEAGDLCDTVIKRLAQQRPSGDIKASQIIQIAQVALNRFDSAASVHYAAFHK